MKTAKQEAIEKAYGEHWDIVGKHVDGDGYLHHPKGGEVTFEPFIGFMDEHPTKDAYRPKSLNGIETNNGWIRIESEEDLPKEESGDKYECGILDIDGKFKKREINVSYVRLISLKKYFTHYKTMKQSLPPIY